MVARASSYSRDAVAKLSKSLWGLLAVILAVTAQTYLARQRVFEAGVLYLAAVVLMVYSVRRQPGPVQPSPPVEKGRPPALRHRLGLVAVSLAAMLSVMALTQFARPLVPQSAWLLYVVSLALFAVANLLMDRGRGEISGERPWSRIEFALLLLILALAAVLRLWGLDQLPFGTWYDEAQNGLTALHILEDSTSRPVYFPRVNSAVHYLYLVAASFRLFGASTAALRMVSALMGIGAVAAGYLTGRELFGRRMGLVLAFLLAVSRWHVNFSRIGMYNASTPLFELVTIGFLLRGIRRERLSDFTWAGMAMGLGMVFYTGFLSFPLVLAFFLAHNSLVERNFFRRFWSGLLVCGVAVLLTVGPVAQYAIRSPEEFWARARKASVFKGKTQAEAWEAVRENAGKHLLMFNYRGDRYGRHNLQGEPMLDPVSGAVMVLGIGVCLWRGRRSRSLLLPVWLGVMLCPGIFSLEWEAPQALRAIGSVPAAYLLAVVPIDGLRREWERGVPQRYARYFVLPVVLLLFRIGYTNYHIYFERQATDFGTWRDFSTAETITAHIMRDLGESVEFYVISLYHSHPTVRFLAPHVTEYHRIETHDSLPLPQTTDKDVVLILDPERFHLYEEAQRYYPGAAFVEYKSPFGGPAVLYSVRLGQGDITSIQGLEGRYRSGNDWSGEPLLTRQDAQLRFDWGDDAPLALPFTVEWNGVLHAHQYGTHRLNLRTPGDAELYLDETLLMRGKGDLSAEVTLAKGSHAVRLRAVGAKGHFELAWQLPDQAERTIPPWALYVPPVTSNGFLGKYFANGEWKAPVAFTQIDPRLGFYFHIPPLAVPYSVEWEGKILIDEEGVYTFGLQSIDESVLYIDGREVTSSELRGQYQVGEAELESGLHDVGVRYAARTAYLEVYLYWTPPGGGREMVPPEVLFPPPGSWQ
ncbi:MAG: hypothetical protein CEE40_10205 [Chloroflexi bacterium B3_Chlor]|nr:MAG: hypothetical protein CEE40_10205 [Chloroflexi bacterium B3_Chlor]